MTPIQNGGMFTLVYLPLRVQLKFFVCLRQVSNIFGHLKTADVSIEIIHLWGQGRKYLDLYYIIIRINKFILHNNYIDRLNLYINWIKKPNLNIGQIN